MWGRVTAELVAEARMHSPRMRSGHWVREKSLSPQCIEEGAPAIVASEL